MGHRSNAAALEQAASVATTMTDGWQPPQEAVHELERARLERTNVMLIGVDGARLAVTMLGLETAAEPVARWRPGLPLVLPALDTRGTLMLEDVDRLPADSAR